MRTISYFLDCNFFHFPFTFHRLRKVPWVWVAPPHLFYLLCFWFTICFINITLSSFCQPLSLTNCHLTFPCTPAASSAAQSPMVVFKYLYGLCQVRPIFPRYVRHTIPFKANQYSNSSRWDMSILVLLLNDTFSILLRKRSFITMRSL